MAFGAALIRGLLACVLVVAAGCAHKTLVLRETVATVAGAEFVILADLTGNGGMDLVFTSWTDGQLLWLPDVGAGTASWEVIAGDLPQARNVVARDVLGDAGIPDLLVSAFRGGHYLFVKEGETWTRVAIEESDYGASGIDAADLGAGPEAEIVTATQGQGGAPGALRVHSRQERTFRVEAEIVVQDPTSIILPDVDGDGLRDIVASDSEGAVWMRNRGNFQFAEPVRLGDPMGFSTRVRAADLTGDGRLDFIVVSSARGVFVVNGDRRDRATQISMVKGGYDIAIRPNPTSGRIDLVLVSGIPTDAVYLLRRGWGLRFRPVRIADGYTTGRSVAIGSLKSGGPVAIVTTSFGNGTVDVWWLDSKGHRP